MRNWMSSCFYVLIAAFVADGQPLYAAEEAQPVGRLMVREVFVPFEDLNVILEGQPQRVLLTREEYRRLKAAAQAEAQARPPRDAAILSADYEIAVQPGRAVITGDLALEVLVPGIQTVALDIGGVGLRAATLDGGNAPIGAADDGRLELFVSGIGRHRLKLDLVAPLETTAATQILNYRLPSPAATHLRLTVPGDVEVKGGAEAISREVDEAGGVTRFRLVPRRGDVSLAMTLNSRLLRQERVVVARSVMIDEVTQAYERLHATFSMAVLHKAVDAFAFVLPEGFEVTHVQSPHMARWSVEEQNASRLLRIHLREHTTDMVVLSLSAIRTSPPLDAWSLPRLDPTEVEGHVSVVGLVLEDRLQARSIETRGLIPVDTSVLAQALPASIFEAKPGAPRVRPIVAGYAPGARFSLTASFHAPEPEVAVTTNLLLTLADKGQEVRGGFALMPKVEKCFHFDFAAPPGWTVSEVTDAGNKPLSVERFAAPKGGTRIHVRLPQGVPPRQEYRLYFQASHQPVGWLEPWTTIETPFPAFTAVHVARETGAVAVAVRDDLTARPTTLERIEPLDEHEKARYGLGGVPTLLAFRFDAPAYKAAFVVERVKPRLSARTFSSFVVKPDFLVAHYELLYDVAEAGARELALVLPKSTPETLAIRGLGNVRIKEYVSKGTDGERRWSMLLAESARGTVRLAVDFQQPLSEEEPKDLPLPVVRADGVVYQSGLISVEGTAELNVEVKTDLRKADIGELVDAEYQPGKRLLGVYRFVGDQPAISVSVRRDPGYGLPPVIVQAAQLSTTLAAEGLAQTAAQFVLRTKAQYVEVELPVGSTLWSVSVDEKPAAPQREGGSLLVGLPTAGSQTLHDLRVIYETPVDRVGLIDRIDVPAPKLRLPAAAGSPAVDVPVANLVWHLEPPDGCKVVSTAGTVVTTQVPSPGLALTRVGEWCLQACGGINWFWGGYGLARARTRGRDLARRGEAGPSQEIGAASRHTSWELLRPAQPGDRVREMYFDAGVGGVKPDDVIAGSTDVRLRPGAPPSPPTPPPSSAPATHPAEAAAKPVPKAAKLEGVRSLRIDLQRTGEQITFRGLGGDPRLTVRMTSVRRSESLAWTLAAVVGLAGLRMARRPLRRRSAFIAAIVALTTLLPLVTGSALLTELLNPSCYVAFLLIPAYLLVAAVRWLVARVRSALAVPGAAAVAGALLLCLTLGVATARADEAEDPMIRSLVERLRPPEPVKVPADAIIVPYDAESDTGIRDATRLLVPYERFVELWNLAHPERRIETAAPPARFALAGASYTTVLQGEEYLLIEGTIEVETYTDEAVAIPLALEGGVLARADLDGKPARLSVVQAREPAPSPKSKASRKPDDQPAAGTLLLLHVSQRGRHRLDLAVRMKLERPGGWRVAQGRIPAAPATALTLTVPQAQTDIRIGQVADRRSALTSAAGETIATALGAGGVLDVRWRPKVAEGSVDRSLTAESEARFDVQEDGLRLDWTVRLAFRHGEREFINLGLPEGYLVAQVTGGNVRGWETRDSGGRREIEVSLLKPARDHEEITIRLWRRGEVGIEDLSTFEVPFVTVPGAAMHQGSMAIRRSPLLNLRTTETSNTARADLAETAASQPAEIGPLGIRPYQGYRFASIPFMIRLEAVPVQARVTARLQTLLRIAERERTVEARVVLNAEHRPLYQVRIALPPDLKIDRVLAPGAFEWAITRDDRGPLLSVYLTRGEQGEVSILLNGSLGEAGAVQQVSLPRPSVLDVDEQEGDIVVQADPAYRVEPRDLSACETVLLTRVHGWLAESQRPLARLALHYRGADYGGTLQVSLRQPVVSCYTVSNVRVTGRAIEETILLDFSIREAGVREIVFLLPAKLKDARISVPQLRQKTVTPLSDRPDAPVRVRLELQDKIMGQLRVLVENDRQLTPDTHHAPIPVVETGSVTRRYVLLESAGRSEVVVEASPGLDALTREQQEWKWLESILGGGVTQAYLVQPQAADADLAFRTRDRMIVETAGASIGLAETLMVVDANGTCLAVQVLRVRNATEQYLEIEMPAGAVLWTAQVAGEPVKPTRAPDPARPRNVRIPLVKTAPGDLDYEVVLKYGARLPALGVSASVAFPLIRTVNIEVELSQVRLYLPETHHWFDFGGTMRRADGEVQLAAGYVAYQTRVAQQLAQTLGSSDDYARVRAAENLGMLGRQMQEFQALNAAVANETLVQKELGYNALIISGADQQIRQVAEELQRAAAVDNRRGLGQYFERQDNDRSLNVVNALGGNFDAATRPRPSATAQPGDTARFRSDWFDANGLATVPVPGALIEGRQEIDEAGLRQVGQVRAKVLMGGDVASHLVFNGDAEAQQAEAAQPRVPSFAQVQMLDAIRGGAPSSRLESSVDASAAGEGKDLGDKATISRYQTVLREKAAKEVSERRSSVSYGFQAGVEGRRGYRGSARADQPADRTMLGYGGGRPSLVAPAEAAPVTGGLLTAGAPVAPTGLASLDVDVPVRGRAHFFTTPRGKVEITARAVSRRFTTNLEHLAIVLVVLVAVLVVYRILHDGRVVAGHARSLATIAIIVGLLSLALGFLPIAGLIIALIGVAARLARRRPTGVQTA